MLSPIILATLLDVPIRPSGWCAETVNVAVTDRSWSIVTTQATRPVQSPLQPTNIESTSGVAVSVTMVLQSKPTEHVAPQSMPAGVEVIEPVPVPFADTSSVSVFSVNVAVTEGAALIVTTQVPVPEQPAPLQPAKSELASGG